MTPTAEQIETDASARGGVLLALASVVMFSTSAIFILGAAPLSPYEITVGRLAVATLLVVVLGRLNGQPVLPARADLPRFAGFGLITALHFVTYIASLNFTTIAHALAITNTAPVFVTLFSAWFLHEPIARRKWFGVFVTVLGIGVLVGFEPHWSNRMLIGDGLALIAGIMYALYSVAGRSLARALRAVHLRRNGVRPGGTLGAAGSPAQHHARRLQSGVVIGSAGRRTRAAWHRPHAL